MRSYFTRYCLAFFCVCTAFVCDAQLTINSIFTAEDLAQKLTGTGVQVSNVRFTGNAQMAGIFYNQGTATNLHIDSGIVLTTGIASGVRGIIGLEGDGSRTADSMLASNHLGLAGDIDIAAVLHVDTNTLHDACILEFDFIPVGDSVSFKYVFSSEEYAPRYVCSFNDAFAFFISGPGITGLENIALVPGTDIPVSIRNVNNVAGVTCNNNSSYYTDNTLNTFSTHDGHTKLLVAGRRVIKCQTYHLKLVITDAVDDGVDSGVFLEAKSLVSRNISFSGSFPADAAGKPYVVEGCASRRLRISKPFVTTDATSVTLQYSGTAGNGTDVRLLPTGVVIPPGQTEIFLDINPTIDNLDEGIETLKITALYSCNLNAPAFNDSIEIQVRDFEPMNITPDSAITCRRQNLQLAAPAGYAQYRWDNNSTLNNTNIRNPVATPTAAQTTYYCTASNGTCKARDSAIVFQKKLYLDATEKVTCRNSSNGSISMSGGAEWQRPLAFSFNNAAYGGDSVFSNLSKGFYILKMKDAVGCVDSINYFLDQQNTDPRITNVISTAASCSGLPDGLAQIVVTGGVAPYLFSIDSIVFNSTDTFNLLRGNYTVYVTDSSGCTALPRPFVIPFSNVLKIKTIADTFTCEGIPVTLTTASDGNLYSWEPSTGLNNDALQSPLAAPSSTTRYIVTGSKGICKGTDTVIIHVNKAPIAKAGNDITICYNSSATLHGAGADTVYWQPAALLSSDTVVNPVTDNLLTSTDFYLMVKDTKGCSSLNADTVTVLVRAPAKVDIGGDTIIAIDQPLQLLAKDLNNSGFSNFSWSPPDGLSNPFIQNPLAVVQKDSVTYTVSTSTPEGCPSSDTMTVKIFAGPALYVPSAFTPNGDGNNDRLHIIAAGVKQLNYFNIYNRWGQLVFSTGNTSISWDGKYKGKNAGAGTYVWIAEGIAYRGNTIQQKGTIVLFY